MKKITMLMLLLLQMAYGSAAHAGPTDIIGNENPNETPHARFVMVVNGPEGSNTVGFRSALILNPANSQEWTQIGDKEFYSVEAIRLLAKDEGWYFGEAIVGDVAVGVATYFGGLFIGAAGYFVGGAILTDGAYVPAVISFWTGTLGTWTSGIYLEHAVNRLNPYDQYYQGQVITPDAITPNKKVQLNMSFQYIKKHLEIELAKIP